MPWETIRLSRDDLYRRVWERPVRDVAKEVGVSDVALAKTCRRLGVPVPERGYWARRAAGAEDRRPPLPAAAGDQRSTHEFRRWVDPGGSSVVSTTDPPASSLVKIAVPDELTEPHPLVALALPKLRQARELRQGLLEREACLAIEVDTHSLVGRALRIMDTLVKALEASGLTVGVTAPTQSHADSYGQATVTPSKTMARSGVTRIAFHLSEGFDRVPATPKKRGGIFDSYVPRPEYKSVPNGVLTLAIDSYHRRLTRRSWSDGKRQRIEDCLGAFVAAAAAVVEDERLEALEEARREEVRERRQQEEAERERRRALEQARTRDLNLRLRRYDRAREIVALADAVEGKARSEGDLAPDSPTARWLDWARARAARLERRALADCSTRD